MTRHQERLRPLERIRLPRVGAHCPGAARFECSNLAVIFICQLPDGSRPHTFGHVAVVDALSIHVPIVWSGLKSGLIG